MIDLNQIGKKSWNRTLFCSLPYWLPYELNDVSRLVDWNFCWGNISIMNKRTFSPATICQRNHGLRWSKGTKKALGEEKKVSFFCSHNQCWLLSTFQPKYLLNFSTILQNSSVPDFWQTQLIPGLVKERGHRCTNSLLYACIILFGLDWESSKRNL